MCKNKKASEWAIFRDLVPGVTHPVWKRYAMKCKQANIIVYKSIFQMLEWMNDE